jgi:hypothetical protein
MEASGLCLDWFCDRQHNNSGMDNKLSHPEAFCVECGKENITWYADNDLWNKVMPDDGGILCPQCFAKKAEVKGLSIIFHCSEIKPVSSESKVLKEA